MRIYDLTQLTASDVKLCGQALASIGEGAASMEDVAGRVVHFFRSEFVAVADGAAFDTRGTPPSSPSESAIVLSRCFVTVPYGELGPDLQQFARGILGGIPPTQAMKCLTLLGTAGDLPAWNSRHTSARHRTLPLASQQSVLRSPMIAQLIGQFGLGPDVLWAPDTDVILDAERQPYNVFYVPEAAGSPYIPAQRDFVLPFGIRSVVGFGGLLSSGDLFAIVLFARCAVSRDTADLFRTLAPCVKEALRPFVNERRFT